MGGIIRLTDNIEVSGNLSVIGTMDTVDKHIDVDTTTTTPIQNDVLKWDGNNWIPSAEGATFTFSILSFDDGESTGILCGDTAGTWQASSALDTFTATYDNGPPTTADIEMDDNGGGYGDVGNMDGPNYTAGKNYDGAITYPTVDGYLQFRLNADNTVDIDIFEAAKLFFYNYIYYGDTVKASGFAAGDVTVLDKAISPSYTADRAVNATSDYIAWAHPNRYTPVIHVNGARFNGITMPFNVDQTALSIANDATGTPLTENYRVYVSTTQVTGNDTLELSTGDISQNLIYYGGSSKQTGNDQTDLKGLTDGETLASNDSTQVWNTITLAAGEYWVMAFPKRISQPSFWFDAPSGGNALSLYDHGGSVFHDEISVTNDNGFTEDYWVYVSNQALGGAGGADLTARTE
jgi:hypothetical protein